MGHFLWIALFFCLGLLVSLQGEISRKNELLVKAMKGLTYRFPSSCFAQLYIGYFERYYQNQLLSRILLSFPDRTIMAHYGVSTPQSWVLCEF